MIVIYFVCPLNMIYLFWKKGVAHHYSFPWRKEQALACLMSNMNMMEKFRPLD